VSLVVVQRLLGTWKRQLALIMGLVGLVCVALFAQRRVDPVPPRAIRGGSFEASGVVAVPGANGVLIVDDGRPKHVLWMALSASGTQVGEVVAVPIHADVVDMEDITTDGQFFYVVGSQSQGGGRKADGLVRFRFHPDSLSTSDVERATGLRQMLAAVVPELQGDSNRGDDVLNIEGLVWDPVRSRLLLGLRSPLSGGQALLVPLRFRDPAQPLSTGNLVVDGALIRLPLGGDGIRGLGYDAVRNVHLLIAGATTAGRAMEFRLFEWDGATAASLFGIAMFPAHQKPEGVTRMMLGGKSRTVLVFDVGGYRVLD
jgi:hypothetical protein